MTQTPDEIAREIVQCWCSNFPLLVEWIAAALTAERERAEKAEAERDRCLAVARLAQAAWQDAEREINAARAAALDEAVKVADEWISSFGNIEINIVSPRKFATDAVSDVRDTIRSLKDKQP